MQVPNPPKGMHWITPHLYYLDIPAAITWLERVFGFIPGEKAVNSAGIIDYTEMSYRGDLIIISQHGRFPGAQSPVMSQCYSQHIHMYVDDIQQHYQRCLSAGARFLDEPAYIYWGDIVFRVFDCEGHLWTFAQHIKNVAEADLQPPE